VVGEWVQALGHASKEVTLVEFTAEMGAERIRELGGGSSRRRGSDECSGGEEGGDGLRLGQL